MGIIFFVNNENHCQITITKRTYMHCHKNAEIYSQIFDYHRSFVNKQKWTSERNESKVKEMGKMIEIQFTDFVIDVDQKLTAL